MTGVDVPHLCRNCAPRREGFARAIAWLEANVPPSDDVRRALRRGEVQARCVECGRTERLVDVVCDPTEAAALRERLWAVVARSADVAVNDGDSLASWLLPVRPDEATVADTDFARYLDFIRATDFDHFGNVLDQAAEAHDTLATSNPVRAARLLAAILLGGSQHVDDGFDASECREALLDEAAKRAFDEELAKASPSRQDSAREWLAGYPEDG